MRSVELFTGAGGLALGVSQAGFRHDALIEKNKHACDSIRLNQSLKVEPVKHWALYQGDIRDFNFRSIRENIDLLAGGPPCQPFSLGGKHQGHQDERDMFPEAVRAVRELKPRSFMFENVRGLLRRSFAKYYGYILLQLTYPEILKKKNEEWLEHLSRLEKYHTGGRPHGLFYNVVFRLLNAADYGVPQKRERVIIVGFRCDQNVQWSFPDPSHSEDALLMEQWVTGNYWERHKVFRKNRPIPSIKSSISERSCLKARNKKPWRTVRDAISDLPNVDENRNIGRVYNHIFIPGARIYKGHTGSPLDEPAKTLKAGDHGVPGGENMLLYPEGKVRYFTIRESARLQTFPDDYRFPGSWTECMRQLGNAVPVRLANILATHIKNHLEPMAIK